MVHPPATQPRSGDAANDEFVLNGQVIKRGTLLNGHKSSSAMWTTPLRAPLIVRDPKLVGRYGVRVAVRTPGRLLAAAVRGTGVLGVNWWNWVNATHATAQLLDKGKFSTADAAGLELIKEQRRLISAKAALAVVTAGGLLALTQTWPLLIGLGATGLLTAAIAGRRTTADLQALNASTQYALESQIIDASVSSEQLTEAFASAGIIKADQEVCLDGVRMPHHDGIALTLTVHLPPGRTYKHVMAAKAALASALDIDERWLDIERVPGSGRQVSLWLADSDPYDRPAHSSPLTSASSWDLWQAIPFGTDKRGRRVSLPLIFTSVLVSSMPRMGKTVVLRMLAMAAALDARTRLYLWDGKGGKDFSPFQGIAHGFGRGVRGDTVERLYRALCDLVAEMNDVYERLDELDDNICPDGKITPEILADPASGIDLKLIVIDEAQRYLEDPAWGPLILEKLVDLAKVGPALGFVVVIATQKSDAEAIPSSLRDQLGTRFVLRVMTWQASEAGLGSNTYKAGYNAADFERHHKGWGLLRGAEDVELGGDVLVVHTDYVDIRDARRVVERATALREEAGTLPGQRPAPASASAGAPADPAQRVPALLADIVALADAEGAPRLSTTAIIDKLALEMTPKALGGLLASWGCPVGKQQIAGREVRGPEADDLRAAVRRITAGGDVEVKVRRAA
ncbi:hypothetical protein [Planomonospora sp. ID82291]|uniref:hypothetical protein n=1 Tax=Planomonospora sp. ID82291 TaxID=2738136 RepID=UPI0018C3C0FB|nr:hypothetical protein [Planomonospora sp. ID82291]MBG0818733.1 hypothetical protein [Planomonospora sp. ID82291]